MYICAIIYVKISIMEYKQIHIKGLEHYQITEDGRVFNTKTGNYRKHNLDGSGYAQITFFGKKKKISVKIHRLVAIAFVPNESGYNVINHLDGNKLNNHYTNLEWGSHSQNRLHAARVLGYNTNKHLFKKGHNMHSKKCEIIRGPNPGIYTSFEEAGKANNTSGSYLSQIVRKGVKSTVFEIRLVD